MKIIELNDISKKYKLPVLLNINYTFLKGKTYLIVGENGSGKSTLIKLILDIVKPSSGRIVINTNGISYVPDNLVFPEFLTIEKYLYNLCLIYKIKEDQIHNILNTFLDKWLLNKDSKLNELSKGMRQKVLIIQALIKDAPIYIFDEPLNGLDKDMQVMFLETLKSLKTKQRTLLIISHEISLFKFLYDYKLKIKCGTLYEEFT